MEKLLISVITCRRPVWLARLLDGLQKQTIDENIDVSILVVDNAADTETENVVKRYSDSPINVVYEVENKPGIVFARNKCIEFAIGESSDYLIFIDDDEWPQQNSWAQSLLNACKEANADIVTSHVISVDEKLNQNWATKVLYPPPNYINGEHLKVFYTNNVLLTKRVFQKLHPCFDIRFAMTGASDYHFSLRARKAGFVTVYTDAPVIEELPASRTNVKWFCKRGFRSGIGYTRSHLFEEKITLVILKCFILAIIRLLRGGVMILKSIFTMNKGIYVDGLFRMSSAVGTIVGLFGVKHNEYKRIHGQ